MMGGEREDSRGGRGGLGAKGKKPSPKDACCAFSCLFPCYLSFFTCLQSVVVFFLDVCLDHCSSPSLCFCDMTIAELRPPCVKKSMRADQRLSSDLFRISVRFKYSDCTQHRSELSGMAVAPLRHPSVIGSDFSDSTCFSRSVEGTRRSCS